MANSKIGRAIEPKGESAQGFPAASQSCHALCQQTVSTARLALALKMPPRAILAPQVQLPVAINDLLSNQTTNETEKKRGCEVEMCRFREFENDTTTCAPI